MIGLNVSELFGFLFPDVVAIQPKFSEKVKFISPFSGGNHAAEGLSSLFLIEENLASRIGFKRHLGGPDHLIVLEFSQKILHLETDFFCSLFKSVVCFG